MNESKFLKLHKNEFIVYGYESEGRHIIPPHFQPKRFYGDTLLWILPKNADEGFSQKITCDKYKIVKTVNFIKIYLYGEISTEKYPSRPLCDFFGMRFSFEIDSGEMLQKAFARFYWDNQLNQIAERTFIRKKKDIREGYVLSTLNEKAYAGTYPAVDHEFHMKGCFAIGGKAEAELTKRMLELQLKIMREDKKGFSRNVCAVQPNRIREYNVWRSSRNRKKRAQMFRITANIEFIEGLYNYYSLTKDMEFIKRNITAAEKNCDYIESFITPEYLLNSHVYYEDQVIKDGPVLQAQLFAVNSFRLMAEIENLLGREKERIHYINLSEKLGTAAVKSYPYGFWDNDKKRFIDWIDKDGNSHDHIHLLANELPEMFNLCTQEQALHCRKIIEAHTEVFEKFPSFVAAKIEDYTDSEIGSGGPYDLCAAGRYWCWDAEYAAFRKDGEKLRKQLEQIAVQAEKDGYFMGERYDMNYVYYNTGKDSQHNWHGASLYYEYPNVFQYVLICKYIGVRRGFNCDIEIEPMFSKGKVILETYGIEFEAEDKKLKSVTNLTSEPITVGYKNQIITLSASDKILF